MLVLYFYITTVSHLHKKVKHFHNSTTAADQVFIDNLFLVEPFKV